MPLLTLQIRLNLHVVMLPPCMKGYMCTIFMVHNGPPELDQNFIICTDVNYGKIITIVYVVIYDTIINVGISSKNILQVNLLNRKLIIRC